MTNLANSPQRFLPPEVPDSSLYAWVAGLLATRPERAEVFRLSATALALFDDRAVLRRGL